jgi:hypothetical protein
MTLTQFCEQSSIPPRLIRAVVRQVGGWGEFQQTARDVAGNGADGGFHGFIYYADTCAFYARYQDEIVQLTESLAGDMGEKSAAALVLGFNCLHGTSEREVSRTLFGTKSRHDTQVANALAWFALEEVSRAYTDMKGI